MYEVRKTFWISAAHRLPEHKGKCKHLHGHNWKILVICQSQVLNGGMVADFGKIKSIITDMLDHTNLNQTIKNPTAENLAEWIFQVLEDNFPVTKVEVEETEGSVACYIP